MKKKIKSLVIGLGNVGLNYDLYKKKNILSHCKAIHLNPDLELIGGVDKNSNQLNKFRKIYKKPSFKSLDEAFETDPELIVISSNTENHYEIFNKIKNLKNLKYILLEKPGTYDYKKLIKIFSICKKKNIKIFVNYFRIYNNYYLNISKEIKKNKNLEIFVIYNRGILNNCSHFISFFNLFLKNLKKIKIYKIYPKIKYDYEADFQIIYEKAKIYFFRNNIKGLTNIKLIINGNKGNWISTKDFNEFIFSRVGGNLLSKSKNYKEVKLKSNKYISIQQSVVYKKIFKSSKKEEEFYKKNSIQTLKILNNLIFKIKKK